MSFDTLKLIGAGGNSLLSALSETVTFYSLAFFFCHSLHLHALKSLNWSLLVRRLRCGALNMASPVGSCSLSAME